MSTDVRSELFDDIDLRWEHLKNRLFLGSIFVASMFGVVALALLLFDVATDFYVGITEFDIGLVDFLTRDGSRRPELAGFKGAIVASVFLMLLTAFLSFFIGVGSAIYLEEYAPDTRLTRLIEANLANLAGVPSIVYGLLALAALRNGVGLGPILLVGAIALALLVMPIIIVSSQEAIRAVPDGVRDGSYATGATKWQTIRRVVLPAALPGIFTGTILALARAIGETAPLLMVGALFVNRTPGAPGLGVVGAPLSRFSGMPTQIYAWAAEPSQHFIHLAAVGIVVLLAIMLSMNAVAVSLRNRYETEV
ncbi:ABC-type phosphate transport system, permease component [Halalkaliarchaeum sp. AArc-CO]|uniref:phosphate ABC transporter permease PstA n=1 Tax=unclassified Halalkaliarchaeum TaxID=2678344 RepID=UPI00217D127A|nr:MULTISPECIES: phosphate ABC transporter permease PstA [unclassified Halalkaliarchaeum]MDR5672211.1 phosphate ABC transporter permease PstA [Halalkaliarchaeum sp. AArc-GB]UWG51717.1 ABC-type phosphate transport system, permease component [Halalkaliarchaeum sp. AArc-CO]